MRDLDLSRKTPRPALGKPPGEDALAAAFGPNAWMVLDLLDQYRRDPQSVAAGWRALFQGDGAPAPEVPDAVRPAPPAAADGSRPAPPAAADATRPAPPAPVDAARPAAAPPAGGDATPSADEVVSPLAGPALRLAQNMTASLAVPTAASVRIVPARILEENRRVLNEHRDTAGSGRISFTHLVAWALVRALADFPRLNDACAEGDGRLLRVRRDAVRLGIAVDLQRKDGTRALLVPNLRDAGRLEFPAFLAAFDAAVAGARNGSAGPDAYAGTTVTLTNAGVAGTTLSMPRLMPGQGLIVATGALDYPAEYRSMAPATRSALGIGKVMAVTSTYDHRITQGAESGALLARLDALLQGEDGFYDRIFEALGVAAPPLRWEPDDAQALAAPPGNRLELEKQARLLQLIRAYRVRGHLVADLDPLDVPRPSPRELEPSAYGLSMWDLDREFYTNGLAGKDRGTLREILEVLRDTYCRTVGAEYMFIQEPVRRDWIQERMEACRNQAAPDAAERLRILDRLVAAEAFERYLHAKYIGHKRFSLEGGEALIPLLDRLLSDAARAGVQEAVVGMPHRGRLNVLANTVGKPLARIFAEFEGNVDPDTIQGSGDVKYHLGAVGTHRAPRGETLTVTLAPNPSHLEAVDPVVEGMVRARLDRGGEAARGRYLPILMHGDAAFAGEGVVAETLNLAELDGYGTGGTIHIVVNNQIGFTTLPQDARSSTYCTDVARMVQAPILHVNGDDPEAVAYVAALAFEYLQRFRHDVVIDLVSYRRWGHNEGDEPSYTQPLMYARIRNHPTVAKIYGDALVRKGVLGEAELAAVWAAAKAQMQEEGVQEPAAPAAPERPAPPGAAPEDLEAPLRTTLAALGSVPPGFEPHPKLLPFLRRRQELAESGGEVDWSTAEALAFGTLVLAGHSVRLSGQDSVRGTFSQRHSKIYDVRTRAEHVPLDAIAARPARFRAFDSLLSEAAVLGFEYGYAAASPETLTLWEAQFGDFANGAQVIIDNFMTSSESKWGQTSGVVLLLPHGYEGQGPEHSSARIERFLQLCAEDNLRVCQPSTPASYFHLLRRQALDPRAKPLIVFTPKSLLRHPRCVSPLAGLARGRFEPVLADPPGDGREARRIVLATGKLVYDLLEHRGDAPAAVLRLEQLHPFPGEALGRALAALPPDAQLVWAQEEPRNQGAWAFVRGCFLDGLVSDPARRMPEYAGRPPAAATAGGSHKMHLREQAAVVQAALGLPEPGAPPVSRAGGEGSASR